MKPELYVWLSMGGSVLFLAGFAYRIPVLSTWELALFRLINAIGQNRLLIRLFRLLWPLGTTAFSVLALLGLILFDPKMGLWASLALFCAGLIERTIKLKLERVRPFAELADVPMHQPRRPKDPSFPSGDSLRVWFLATLLVFLYQWSLPVILGVLLLAFLVSVGRIAMGVHYPNDVLGGAGLGILAAGSALLVSSFRLLG